MRNNASMLTKLKKFNENQEFKTNENSKIPRVTYNEFKNSFVIKMRNNASMLTKLN